MPMTRQTCKHPQRLEIKQAIIAGEASRGIDKRFSRVSDNSLESILQRPRIIDSIGVGEQSFRQRTKVNQMLPISIVEGR
jgi:hypothetical protein